MNCKQKQELSKQYMMMYFHTETCIRFDKLWKKVHDMTTITVNIETALKSSLHWQICVFFFFFFG